GADVMTGFPGESDGDFEETRRFIEAMPFTYLHVFTYSERPGTPATEAPDSVPVCARRERNQELRRLADQKNREFRERMAGRRLSAVTLHQPGRALTDNYLDVELAAVREPHTIVEINIGGLTGSGLFE